MLWANRLRSRSALRLGVVALVVLLAAAIPAAAQPFTEVAVWFLGFNVTQPPFDNVAARRAVAMSLERARIAAINGNTLANSIEPGGCLAHNAAARPHPFNLQDAKALLAHSGVNVDELGSLGLWYLSALSRGNRQAELQVLVENIGALGLSPTLREFGAYSALQRIATQPVVKMSYWGLRSTTRACGQESFLEDLAHSRGPFNYFGYRNPEVDALIQRAISAPDRAGKAQLYAEAEQRVLDDAVFVPIYWYGVR